MRWLLVAVLCMGCERTPVQQQWLGMDRSMASCVDDGWQSADCVGGGRQYRCLREAGSSTWRCAEVRAAQPQAEAQ